MTTKTQGVEKMNLKDVAHQITLSARKLDNDINGNPRYYLPLFMFSKDDNKGFFKPYLASSYRGKKYGAGWVFQSYSLESDILYCLQKQFPDRE